MSETIYNAVEGLEGFNPEESRPMRSRNNHFENGSTYLFIDTGESATWSDDQEYAVLEAKGLPGKFNAPYVASCMLQSDELVLNKDAGNEKLICMHNPRTAADEKLEFSYMQKHIDPKTNGFKKLKAVATHPVAIERQGIIDRGSKERLALYEEYLGTPLDKLTCKYVPSLKRSKYGDRGFYHVNVTMVELAE